jgi:hypothetical protein
MQSATGGKVSLEKRLESEAPKLVSLAKPLRVSLEKNNLSNTIARVGLVLDISGSMSRRYQYGVVQDIINMMVPLAVQFDDDGELDLWYYGTTAREMDSVNTGNYEFAATDWKTIMRELGGLNNEPDVIKLVVNKYMHSTLPAYVLFISDGGVNKSAEITRLIRESAQFPVFWQFVGVGGQNYGIFEHLDSMTGRVVDNASFFAVDDFKSIEPEELYKRMLYEFPSWLKEAKSKGILK